MRTELLVNNFTILSKTFSDNPVNQLAQLRKSDFKIFISFTNYIEGKSIYCNVRHFFLNFQPKSIYLFLFIKSFIYWKNNIICLKNP